MHKGQVKRGWAIYPIIFALAALTGCVHRDWGVYQTSLGGLPARREISGVPFYRQEAGQCGPAALAAVLSWSGSPVTPEEISDEIFTPGRKGSLQPMLVSASRDRGRVPFVIRSLEDLLEEAAAGHPIIVLQNLGLTWYPRWHYAVVIGYDLEKRLLIVRSGMEFRKKTNWSVFCRTWERAGKWGLVVLPLNERPASGEERSYLEAVLSLEKTGRYEEASTAYQTALERWPDSRTALMGLGNSLYAAGDLHQAEKAFRSAAERFPSFGDGYNNLAQVLAELGRYEEALEAASKAVRLGGPNQSAYHETLQEIRALRSKDG